MRLLRTDRIDLMQIHNLVDWRTQLATLRDWKASGRIRYIGITHYTRQRIREVEAVLRAEKLDFLQINYSLDDRAAEERLLPLAAERGVAVIVNLPFGGGGLLRGLRDRPLPGWAAEIGCTSWAQVLLKFVLSHPAVTCAIPGTRRARAHGGQRRRARRRCRTRFLEGQGGCDRPLKGVQCDRATRPSAARAGCRCRGCGAFLRVHPGPT